MQYTIRDKLSIKDSVFISFFDDFYEKGIDQKEFKKAYISLVFFNYFLKRLFNFNISVSDYYPDWVSEADIHWVIWNENGSDKNILEMKPDYEGIEKENQKNKILRIFIKWDSGDQYLKFWEMIKSTLNEACDLAKNKDIDFIL